MVCGKAFMAYSLPIPRAINANDCYNRREGRRGFARAQRGERVLKRTENDAAHSDKVAMLHQLLKLTNRLMAPFSTHLSHRYKISLNEFRLLMTIGALGADREPRAGRADRGQRDERQPRGGDAAAARADRGRARSEQPPPQVAHADRGRPAALRDHAAAEREGGRLPVLRPRRRPRSRSSTTILTHLIATLEAKDEQGRSLFLERTKPDSTE